MSVLETGLEMVIGHGSKAQLWALQSGFSRDDDGSSVLLLQIVHNCPISAHSVKPAWKAQQRKTCSVRTLSKREVWRRYLTLHSFRLLHFPFFMRRSHFSKREGQCWAVVTLPAPACHPSGEPGISEWGGGRKREFEHCQMCCGTKVDQSGD